MSAEFQTENAALEIEISEAEPYLAGDLGFLSAWESNSSELYQIAHRLSSGFIILSCLGSIEFVVLHNPFHILCFIVSGILMSISGCLFIIAETVQAKEKDREIERFLEELERAGEVLI